MARASDWSRDECEGTVRDYLEMLSEEVAGRSYSKAEHNRALQARLNGRSRGAVEFKHQNISAELDHRGIRYIEGHKPRGNRQALLVEVVGEHLSANPSVVRRRS